MPSLAGAYRGMVNIDGQPFQAEGVVTQRGSELRIRLGLHSGVTADGGGAVKGNDVHLELAYGSDCPGTLILDGTVAEGGHRLTGRLRARDCTGDATGSFHLDRP